MMKTLYLIRHGAVDVPPGTCYGRSDVPLREPAAVSAARLRPSLPANFALFSSPLTRCRALAEALGAPSTTLSIDPRLMELDFGEWEMRPFAEIPREAIDAWARSPFDFRPPGGESVGEMRRRVLEALKDIRQCMAETEAKTKAKNEAIVIVTHGGPLRIISGHVRNLPETAWIQPEFDYASLTTLAMPESL